MTSLMEGDGSSSSLTPDGLVAVLNTITKSCSPQATAGTYPIVQCLQIASITVPNSNAPTRFRLILFDGTNSAPVFIAPDLNERVHNDEIMHGTLLRIMECQKYGDGDKAVHFVTDVHTVGLRAHPPWTDVPLCLDFPGFHIAHQQQGTERAKQGLPELPGEPIHVRNQNAPPPANPYGGNGGGPNPYAAAPAPAGQQRQQQPPNPYGGGGGGGGGGENPYGGYGGYNNGPPPQQQQQQPPANPYGGMNPYGGGPPPNQPPNPYGGGGMPPNPYDNGGGMYQQQQQKSEPAGRYTYNRQGGPTARNEAPARVMPIRSLNPFQNRWTIKARVTKKQEVRRWSNARGEGKVFSFDLLDADGGEIRATCFNDAADRWDPVIEMGKVYIISKGTLKPKRKQFNNLNSDYEIGLEATALVEECAEDGGSNSIAQVNWRITAIADVQNRELGTLVDVAGVVETVDPLVPIMLKNGTETTKRSITIKDPSSYSIEVTLWGKQATDAGTQIEQMVTAGNHPVLAVKDVKVGEFSGRNLSTLQSSQLFVDPLPDVLPQALDIRQWYDVSGKNETGTALTMPRGGGGGGRSTRRISLAQIDDEGLADDGNGPHYVESRVRIHGISDDRGLMYPGCPTITEGGKQCNKKLTDEGNGQWRCERCMQVHECPSWRYLFNLKILDHTTTHHVSTFTEAGETLIGLKAEEMNNLKDTDAWEVTLKNAQMKMWNMKLKVFQDSWNGEMRKKTTVVEARPVDFAVASRELIDGIAKLKEDKNPFPPMEPKPDAASGGGMGMGMGMGMGGHQQHAAGRRSYDPAMGGDGGGGKRQNVMPGGGYGGYGGFGGGGGGGYGGGGGGGGGYGGGGYGGYGGGGGDMGGGGRGVGGQQGGGGGAPSNYWGMNGY